ncbi:DUF6188 family protein [Cryptosporangium phraense]|uniref:Uncharacterized protein n=1 Tax=Cryptosporangium phraense TaxID=2593070 RepID=A0A545B0Z5_9ACTN|nr:DUF6188 family protein [Cryptosporangium phraense]TQS46505.1 hypothetical protein FL583_03725 [Cryptosporangium phraense]
MEIALAGCTLDSFEWGFSVNLAFSAGWEVRIEGRFGLRTPHAGVMVDPATYYGREIASPALAALVGRAVEAAEVSRSGLLAITFDRGPALTVGPDDEYESWTVAGPGGVKVICGPGGEVTSWPAG